MSRRLPGSAGRLALIDFPSAMSSVASAKEEALAKEELPHLFPNLFAYAGLSAVASAKAEALAKADQVRRLLFRFAQKEKSDTEKMKKKPSAPQSSEKRVSTRIFGRVGLLMPGQKTLLRSTQRAMCII